MNDDKLEDLEGLDGSEPINPEQKLSELGVRRSDEIASNTQHRKTPRRNGKGVNKNLVKQPATPTDTIPQSAGLAVANAATSEFSAEDFGGEKLFAGRRIIDFLKVAKPFAILSAILTILGLVAILTKGLNLGLDFTGGVSATVVYEQPVQQAQVQSALASHKINDSVVQYLGSNKEILVRLPPQKQIEGLSNSLDAALDLPNNNATIKNIDVVGSQVGNEIYVSSLGATALALLCMFIYVMVRFQAKLALGAVLALFHDTIITVGIFALFGWPFDLTVLAAVLSLIGYSINDTIVVFDRIRENFRRVRGASPAQIVNLSLTETLRRTIMTISTVLLVVVAMLLLGGDSLHWFSVALLIGLILGTFSSVYIASAIPLWLGMSRKDFIVEVKPEFVEEEVVFEDRNAPIYDNKVVDNQ
ncbi:MAG: protein translocase subunit SecF [Moraxella sp.]|jgi:preprotein translocase subunit SecF|nr:protein translocase subunit SecF [Moraxella osloensis]MBP6340760.1 protein translocase subunit SecF [Moraxella sp.]MBP6484882.1 protein translocase subunit SecF [Moraxella sp.]MBP7233434.1 protein translocase subunit SecF [Moraxella sp.]